MAYRCASGFSAAWKSRDGYSSGKFTRRSAHLGWLVCPSMTEPVDSPSLQRLGHTEYMCEVEQCKRRITVVKEVSLEKLLDLYRINVQVSVGSTNTMEAVAEVSDDGPRNLINRVHRRWFSHCASVQLIQGHTYVIHATHRAFLFWKFRQTYGWFIYVYRKPA